jgi:hypothetical protein
MQLFFNCMTIKALSYNRYFDNSCITLRILSGTEFGSRQNSIFCQ